jgi:hypothetical protein
MKSIDLDVGDHVTTDGLGVQVIAHRRVTPSSESGISFLLLPSGEVRDSSKLNPVTEFSHREYVRDDEEDEDA